MKYFAKYLPVEGKGGDEGRIINGKFCKLFLCSRDIQNIKVDFDQQQWQEMGIDEKDSYLLKTGQYKVIGEISPDATWVKDGDEFVDDNIRLGAGKIMEEQGFRFIPFETEEEHKQWFANNGWEKYSQVKGPCGHFH